MKKLLSSKINVYFMTIEKISNLQIQVDLIKYFQASIKIKDFLWYERKKILVFKLNLMVMSWNGTV